MSTNSSQVGVALFPSLNIIMEFYPYRGPYQSEEDTVNGAECLFTINC